MLDLKFIRENPDKVKQAAAAKNQPVDIDALLKADEERREFINQADKLKNLRNVVSKEIAELAKAKNCLACHAIDKKLVGPSYKDVAAKYATDKDAVAKLSKKVREGGVGVWGQVPMPANPQVNEQEAQTLVKWVLSQK